MFERKVLIIVGDATETVDTLYPYFRLIEGDIGPSSRLRRNGAIKWYCMK